MVKILRLNISPFEIKMRSPLWWHSRNKYWIYSAPIREQARIQRCRSQNLIYLTEFCKCRRNATLLLTSLLLKKMIIIWFKFIQGVQERLCFFTFHCNPSLAYIAVKDLQSSQRNANVQSLLLAFFCTTNSSRVLARERWQTFENSWKKIQYLMNTL